MPGLVIVSNRLPVSVKKTDGKLEFYPSIGGLATGLGSYATTKKNKWIGWPGIASDNLTEKDKQAIADELLQHNCYPVFLTQKQLSDYYNGYSNSLLWPLFHDVPIAASSTRQQTRFWKAYRQVNTAFAEVTVALSGESDTIWVHDYQLLLLPGLLRAERPAANIGFFLHTPFPEAANFAKLDNGETLVSGLLGSNLIGFHTESYVQNFLRTIEHYGSGIVAAREVILPDRPVRVTDFPIGIDYAKFTEAAKLRSVKKELAKLKLKYGTKKLILTVDRLDPAKGLVERAAAYQTLLRQNPRLRQKVILFMLVVPSRTEIKAYQQLKTRLEKLIADIKGEFGTKRWQPIEYLYDALPFERLRALYQRADVAFIAPLRDGMNLVAKEYLASKPAKNGVLILSQTAGAAEELKDAILVNHAEPASLVQGLQRALTRPSSEHTRRVARMQKLLSSSTIQVWAGNFIDSLKQTGATPGRVRSLSAARQQQLLTDYRQARSRLILLDYDGVLVPFHDDPNKASPSNKLKRILRTTASQPGTDLVIISGRKKEDLEKWLGDLPIALVAEHGNFSKQAGRKRWQTAAATNTDWQTTLLPLLEKYARKTPGASVEQKATGLVWHYRRAKPYQAQKYLVVLKRALKPLLEPLGLQARQGNMILEVRPAGINKGSAAALWLAAQPGFVLAVGDDYTDEDMFAALPDDAYSIKVGRGQTKAKYRVRNVDAVLSVLEKLSKA